MSVLAVIPARYGSTRLPGKLLLADTGRPLIAHVYEQVRKCRRIDRTVVATDDARIRAAVEAIGGEAVLTRADHASGTERVAEAVGAIGGAPSVVLNVQGDEPEIDPDHLERLARAQAAGAAFATTLACPFPAAAREGPGSPADPACVKVVMTRTGDHGGRALYFTRALAPHPAGAHDGPAARPQDWLLHVGVYAASPETLARFAAAPPSELERRERLEQLRILEMGERIDVLLVEAAAPGVDTADDYAAFVGRWRRRNSP